MTGRGLSVGLLAALLALSAASEARAGGFEFSAAGTRALGRGGAFYARADDPMALLYNPANLAALSGTQLELDAHVAFFGACFSRGTSSSDPTFFDHLTSGRDGIFSRYDPADHRNPGVNFAGETWADNALSSAPTCNGGGPGVVPELVFTWRASAKLGFGAGLLAPAAVGNSEWGDGDGGARTSAGTRVPSPARYLLISQRNIMVFPSVGFGYSFIPELRVGATFGWGIGAFDFTSDTVPTAGESPDADVRSNLVARDFFVPAVTVSVHMVPTDALDLMLGFRWVDHARAGGTDTLTHGVSGVGQEGVPIPSTVRNVLRIEDVTLDAPHPWQASFGVRYADRIAPRPRDTAAVERLSGRVEDPMSNERWDVELDAVYEINSRVDEFVVRQPASSIDLLETNASGTLLHAPLPVPTLVRIPHHWKDQLSLRLGGDYNVLPGLAALRLGFSFETNGIDKRYANLDFMPGMRFGVHGGLTVRLGHLDISLAYAHIFQGTLEVSADEARVPQVDAASGNPGTDPSGGWPYVNAGTYRANFDVLSASVDWHI